MLGINKGCKTALLLCFRYNMESHCRLTGALGTIDLNDASLWNTADTQSNIQINTACWYHGNTLSDLIPHPHDSTFSELAFNACQRGIEGFFLIFRSNLRRCGFLFLSHLFILPW